MYLIETPREFSECLCAIALIQFDTPTRETTPLNSADFIAFFNI